LFMNPFSTPYIPHSWGTLEAGGHPQTPAKGALPLWTPQLLNNLEENYDIKKAWSILL